MEFGIKSGHPEKQRSACIVAGVFEPRRLSPTAEAIDKASDGYISNIIRRGDLEGSLGQVLLLHNVPNTLADRVLLIGCGKERELGDKQYFEIIKKTIKTLNNTGSMEAVCFLSELNVKGRDSNWKLRQAIIAAHECLYNFDELKSKKDNRRRPLRKVIFTVPTRRELAAGETAINEGMAIASGVKVTKNLGNMPPNICTPEYLANYCLELDKNYKNINTAVLAAKELESLGMNAILTVGKGSDNPPCLITMQYSGSKKKDNPVVLVGKGITFDTGGNSLKPPANMIGMKYDMCGAAAVIGTITAAAELELPINIVGVVAAAENMPGGKAARPDDIITTMSGLTVEILNTDAEGRLVLADALTYAERFNPDTVIDMATLTGACLVALGKPASAMYTNHNPLGNELLSAGNAICDRAWQMPLWEDYVEQLKSNVADFANVGGPEAGSVTAACFLWQFAKKYNWAHLDIAGAAATFTGKDRTASGRPVPLLMQYLINKVNNNN